MTGIREDWEEWRRFERDELRAQLAESGLNPPEDSEDEYTPSGPGPSAPNRLGRGASAVKFAVGPATVLRAAPPALHVLLYVLLVWRCRPVSFSAGERDFLRWLVRDVLRRRIERAGSTAVVDGTGDSVHTE